MATYKQGYDKERFESTINRNFLCLICFNVLREPVLCPRNGHCFCRSCITKHLENSQRCPTCADEMNVEALTEPNRMVKDYLDELNIHCDYFNRGCHEIAQLQHLDRHEATCRFAPVVCTNQGCGATVNRRDLVHHESELCEFRKLKRHSCGEITKTLTVMETRIATVESSISTMETKMTNMEKNMEKNIMKNMQNVEKNMENMRTKLANMETNMERNMAEMEAKIEAVNDEVKGLKASLIEGFDEMKEVLVKIEGKRENTRATRSRASGDKENLIVAGGDETVTVEIFNWSEMSWSPLQSIPKLPWGATSFIYNNHITIAGGECPDSGSVSSMIRMNIDQAPDLSTLWSNSPVKLPANLSRHSSVLYNDRLIVTGGYNGNLKAISDCIDEVQLVPPYTTKTLSRMPEPRQQHSTQIFDNNLLIFGGTTTGIYKDSLSSVVQYDLNGNKCEALESLPYAVCSMATVRWGDNVVVIGGADNYGKELDKVAIYNVKTKQCHMLPQMKYKREGCAAVVFRDNIVVMGGHSRGRKLKSVEAFNFDRYTWEELPEMSQKRWFHVAAAV